MRKLCLLALTFGAKLLCGLARLRRPGGALRMRPPVTLMWYERPASWMETDKANLEVFLKTPTGTKFIATLHTLVMDRALLVCDRSPYEHGMTGGMSFLLGEIERLSCEGEPVGETE